MYVLHVSKVYTLVYIWRKEAFYALETLYTLAMVVIKVGDFTYSCMV